MQQYYVILCYYVGIFIVLFSFLTKPTCYEGQWRRGVLGGPGTHISQWARYRHVLCN